MAENGADSTLGPFDWRRELLQMCFRQGPAFLLLALVLYGLYASGQYAMTTAVPAHLDSIKSGYKEIAGQMEKSVDRIASSIEKDSMRDEAQNKAILAKLEEINSTAKSNKPRTAAEKASSDHP